MSNKVIWALYDDGYGSWNKLNKDNIISIGINDNNWNNYKKIDISLNNHNLIKDLKKLPKPYTIIASPPCESWSIADNQQRLYRKSDKNNITLFNKNDINRNNEMMHKCRKRDYYKQWRTWLLGASTALALNQIIEYFKPEVWIIENPQSSKIWEFLDNFGTVKGIRNVAHYNVYDYNFTKKPTCFLSNINLELKKGKVKSCKKWSEISGYTLRAAIPNGLIKDILTKIERR